MPKYFNFAYTEDEGFLFVLYSAYRVLIVDCIVSEWMSGVE